MGETEIRVWMYRNRFSARKIAAGYCASEQFIGQFLKGRRTSKGLVEYLVDKGCPEENFKNGKVAA